MGDGADGWGVSNPEQEPSPTGQGTGPSSGLRAHVLGPPSGGSCPGRLWGCAGCSWFHGTWLCGRDGASGASAQVSRVLSWGTAQPGAGHGGGLGRMGPTLSPARACSPFKPVDTSAQTLSWGSPGLPSGQCSQTPLLLPSTSLTPAPTSPQLQAPPAPLPQPRAPSHPALLSPFSPISSRPWLRQSPSPWLCWLSSTS